MVNKKKCTGFTLIELLVSISIFVMISGLMIANFRSGNNNEELRKSAELVASRMREAQTRSLAGVGGLGIVGHGIRAVNGQSFFVSYQDDGDYTYDSDEQVATTGLLSKVTIVSGGDFLFAIPSGDLYSAGTIQTGSVTMTLTHGASGNSIDISTNAISGQVTISDIY